MTRTLRDFRGGEHSGRSAGQALLAMVGWANRQPADAGAGVQPPPLAVCASVDEQHDAGQRV
jgi:hypothetical protein